MPAMSCTTCLSRSKILVLLQSIAITLLLVLGLTLAAVPIIVIAMLTPIWITLGILYQIRWQRGGNVVFTSPEVDGVAVSSASPRARHGSLGLTTQERNRLLLETTSPPRPISDLLREMEELDEDAGSSSAKADGLCCSICLSPYVDDDTLGRRLACGHVFHMACIDSWANKQSHCPLCREDFSKGFDLRGTVFEH
ncbi:hypothetical protein FOZ63_003230 [Perkinsus olseni]|nr:hypothetical protein FOZ63_003230 [Perkinsus olseni]